jgi:hypothetical protein
VLFVFGGERGIRTLDRVAPMPPFQGGDLNRSSISPKEGGIIPIKRHAAKSFERIFLVIGFINLTAKATLKYHSDIL